MIITPETRIKILLIDYLISKANEIDNQLIGCEVPYLNGNRWVDILLIKNGKMTAFEIKSDADSSRRFEGQSFDYLKTFDETYLVVGESIAKKIPFSNYSNKIGVLIIDAKKGSIRVYRKATSSKPRRTNLVKFLWKEDLYKILSRRGRLSVEELRDLYVKNNSFEEIHFQAINALKNRYEKRYSRFLNERGEHTSPADLFLLTNDFFEIKRTLLDDQLV